MRFELKIDTKSNLNFATLESICTKLNLSTSSFDEQKSLLNQLVNVRNNIAHGENSYEFSEFEDIEKYITLLDKLIQKFYDELDLLLSKQMYFTPPMVAKNPRQFIL